MAQSWPVARDLMSPRPTTVPSDAPLSRALGMMSSNGYHELPVVDRKRLVGMVTLDSIARRTNLPLTTKVEHLMVLPPLVTELTPYPELAERLLAAGLRAAPVMGKKNDLLGIVSRTDLVRALPDLASIANHSVDDLAQTPNIVLRETDSLESILGHTRTLEEHPIPVVDKKGRLTGAVGIADLTRVFWKPVAPGKRDPAGHGERASGLFDVAIRSVMHSPAVTVPRGTVAGVAARVMSEAKVSSVFVLEDGKPVGVVSQVDLLGLAVGALSTAGSGVSDVYVQLHGLRGADAETLAEIDRVIALGLRRIGRHGHPLLLSLHITPQGNHRSGEASVQARLHTDRGIFYASDTEWNYFAGIAALMDELAEQVRRAKEEQRRRRPPRGRVVEATEVDETVGTPELEAQIRAATGRRRR